MKSETQNRAGSIPVASHCAGGGLVIFPLKSFYEMHVIPPHIFPAGIPTGDSHGDPWVSPGTEASSLGRSHPSSRSSSPIADGELSSLPGAPVLCISGVHECGRLWRFTLLQALQRLYGAKPP